MQCVPTFDRIAGIRLESSGRVWARLQRRLAALGLADRVCLPKLYPRLVEQRVVVALAHRAALEQAVAAGAERLLVLED